MRGVYFCEQREKGCNRERIRECKRKRVREEMDRSGRKEEGVWSVRSGYFLV